MFNLFWTNDLDDWYAFQMCESILRLIKLSASYRTVKLYLKIEKKVTKLSV